MFNYLTHLLLLVGKEGGGRKVKRLLGIELFEVMRSFHFKAIEWKL